MAASLLTSSSSSSSSLSVHQHRPENARSCSNPITYNRILTVSVVAILVIGALGASGVLSTQVVGFSLAGLGALPLLNYAYDKVKGNDGDFSSTILTAALPLGIGLGGALGGNISARAVYSIALTIGTVGTLGSCSEFYKK